MYRMGVSEYYACYLGHIIGRQSDLRLHDARATGLRNLASLRRPLGRLERIFKKNRP